MSLSGLLQLLSEDFPGSSKGSGYAIEPAEERFAARRGVRPLYVASLWQRAKSPTLVLTPRADDSRRLYDQLVTYLGESAPSTCCLSRKSFPSNALPWIPAPLTSVW